MSAGVLQSEGIPLRLASEAHKRFGTSALTQIKFKRFSRTYPVSFDRTTLRMTLYTPALNICGLHGKFQGTRFYER
jgi:hypothetical protein